MQTFTEAALLDALSTAQRLGFLGDRPVSQVVEHARQVVAALDGVTGRVVDLGSGGGVPGLVIALDRPDLQVTLIDRRTKRTDALDRIVRRHGLGDRVEVIAGDVEQLARACEAGVRERFSAATARGFGPPEVTLGFMARLVRPGGRLVVTEPPSGDRWDPTLLGSLALRRVVSTGGVAVFHVEPSAD